ncbi:MAG TPA: YceI family protein, partial [Cytophagaceae bacterium]
ISKSNVTFFSKAPLENIEASNKDSKGIIVAGSMTFLFKIPIKSFHFPSSLMEEHFNENYLESEKYPYATYKGKIEKDFDLSKDGVYLVDAVGDLTMHGVTKSAQFPSVITVKNGKPTIQSKFIVKLKDYNITIPSVVFNKIAEQVEVSIDAAFDSIK